MTAVFADPYEEFLAQDPTILREPELTQEQAVNQGHGWVAPALGIGAAYLVYRSYMSRRMKTESQKLGMQLSKSALRLVGGSIWFGFAPRWVTMTAPYLAAGYYEGARQASAHQVPQQLLQGIAQDYARELGNQLNETSMDAVLSGYQAQVNRKVPPIQAAQRVSDAYGVTQRPMNTLVNVWTGQDAKVLSDQTLPSPKEERAKMIINAQNAQRARTIGEHEAFAARTQGKQVVWMYGVEHGIIPTTAVRRWVTAADEKVCPVCGPMDGKESPVSEKFDTKAGKLWTPPMHVNCRCDLLLDVDPIDELNALMDEQSVAKAMGQDRYDRSSNGRFARTESRRSQMDEDDENFAAMLARVNRALTPAAGRVETSVPEQPERVEELPKIGGGKIGTTKIGGGKIAARTGQIGKPQQLGLPKVGTPQQIAPKIAARAEGPQVGQPKVGQAQVSGSKIDRPKVGPQPLVALSYPPIAITDEPVKTPHGTWPPLDFSLVAVLTQQEYDDLSVGGTTKIGLQHQFYEKHATMDTDANTSNSALGERVRQHWEDVIDHAMGEYKDKYGTRNRYLTYRPLNSTETFIVDEDSYYEAVYATVHRYDEEDGEHNKQVLHRTGGFAKTIDVNPVEIAEYLSLKSLVVDANQPILLETKHASPDTRQAHGNQRKDVWINPGLWHGVEQLHEEGDEYDNPYTIIEAEPVDSIEPTDFTWPRSS